MKFGPNLFAGFPDDFAETATGVLQCHDKQSGAAIGGFPRKTCRRTEAIVHLGFFSGRKLQTIILAGILFAQRTAKAFHAVVSVLKGIQLDQVLINSHGVTPQTHLFFNPGTMFFAG